MARADGQWSNKTVPAMNLRGLDVSDVPRRLPRGEEDRREHAHLRAGHRRVGVRRAAAGGICGGRARGGAAGRATRGPIFLQADHAQINAAAYKKDGAAETERLRKIMREQVAAGLYNIDIDASTVVDLALPTVVDQQRLNAEITADFTHFVRGIEPKGVTISLGAEIGEVGHHTTTPEELRAVHGDVPAGGKEGRGQGPGRRQQDQRQLRHLSRRQGAARRVARRGEPGLRDADDDLRHLSQGIPHGRRRAARRLDLAGAPAREVPGRGRHRDPSGARFQQSRSSITRACRRR